MPATTTTLKLPDALKERIAEVAALEGKSAHALMVDTLQGAMEDAMARHQFYADAQAAYQRSLSTNAVFVAGDVRAYAMARLSGGKPARPRAQPLDATLPMSPVHD